MNLSVAQETNIGNIRDENQDALAWFSHSTCELFIVADGVGGELGGSIAANLAVEAINGVFARDKAPVPELLENAIKEANRQIFEDSRYPKMCTTIVVLVIQDYIAHVAHVGDSRIYFYREGHLEQLTKDHSKVQEEVDKGNLSADEAENHWASNIITRSLGINRDVNVEMGLEPIELHSGDQLLLCTDGLSGMVHAEDIRKILSKNNVEDACKNLISSALNKGGDDNITAQIVSVKGGKTFTKDKKVSNAKKSLFQVAAEGNMLRDNIFWLTFLGLTLAVVFLFWFLGD